MMIHGGYSISNKREEAGWQQRNKHTSPPVMKRGLYEGRTNSGHNYVGHNDSDDDNTSVTSFTSCDSDSSTIRAMRSTIRKFDSLCQSLDINHMQEEPLLDFGWGSDDDDEESVDFLVDVILKYELLTDTRDQYAALKAIVDMYLAPDSAHEVNVSEALRKDAGKWVEKRSDFANLDESRRMHVLDRQRDEICKV